MRILHEIIYKVATPGKPTEMNQMYFYKLHTYLMPKSYRVPLICSTER